MAIRTIEVRERVMAKNDELAASVRERLQNAGIAAFNLVSSPGSGKTTLLEHTLDVLGEELGVAVITGDVQTQNDADRIAKHTTRLVQAVVTGGACHLDARQISTALDALDLDETRLLFRGRGQTAQVPEDVPGVALRDPEQDRSPAARSVRRRPRPDLCP